MCKIYQDMPVFSAAFDQAPIADRVLIFSDVLLHEANFYPPSEGKLIL